MSESKPRKAHAMRCPRQGPRKPIGNAHLICGNPVVDVPPLADGSGRGHSPAINDVFRAGDGRRAIRGEEGDQIGDLGGL